MRHTKTLWLVLEMMLFCVVGSVLVTVQSQTQEAMDALTLAVQMSPEGGPGRSTLGAIEATMSRVVDVDSDYLVTVPLSVPTLTILDAIDFNQTTQTWTLSYRSMASADDLAVNKFSRVLYMSYLGGFSAFDRGNSCLDDSHGVCFDDLRDNYISPLPVDYTIGYDYVEFPSSAGASITSRASRLPHSLVEIINITIKHTTMRDILARSAVETPEWGAPRTVYTFGIGMLFVFEDSTTASNVIMFDTFNLYENTMEQVAISKFNSYAVAKHVSFFSQVVHDFPSIRILTVEYVLDLGQEIYSIDAALNGDAVTAQDCEDMQAAINSLSDASCLEHSVLCTVDARVSNGLTWVTYTVPIPGRHTGEKLKVNTLLNTTDTTDTGSRRPVLSTLNFETSQSPMTVCADVVHINFNPMQYVTVTLLQSDALTPTVVDGNLHMLTNASVPELQESMSLTDSLVVILFKRSDSLESTRYFESTDAAITLDELYMSHAVPSVVFPAISNSISGTLGVTGTYGRSVIALDPMLTSLCAVETVAFNYQSGFDCVTTQDYGLQGPSVRPHSNMNSMFVVQVTQTDADLAWLQSNIYGSSTQGLAAASSLRLRLQLLMTDATSVAYFVWPVYAWPDMSPIGLRDRTFISFSWSLGVAASAPPAPVARRLLQADAVRLPFRLLIPYHNPMNNISTTIPPSWVQQRPVQMPIRPSILYQNSTNNTSVQHKPVRLPIRLPFPYHSPKNNMSSTLPISWVRRRPQKKFARNPDGL